VSAPKNGPQPNAKDGDTDRKPPPAGCGEYIFLRQNVLGNSGTPYCDAGNAGHVGYRSPAHQTNFPATRIFSSHPIHYSIEMSCRLASSQEKPGARVERINNRLFMCTALIATLDKLHHPPVH